MTVDSPLIADICSHFGRDRPLLRVIAPGRLPEAGDAGWHSVDAVTGADCWLVDCANLRLDGNAVTLGEVARSGLPLVVVASDGATPAEWIDAADAYVVPGDNAAVVAGVLTRAAAPQAGFVVADLSDGIARTINALSAETGRIAEQLAALAAIERTDAAPVRGVDATLVRRMIKLRRDRDRFLPAEIFADPAWDMLLDLTAARLEGRSVPVSSLCIAAAVPTTTALRWVRSLPEAGLLERRMDPADARRSHVALSDAVAAAMLDYLRSFSTVFALR